MNKKKITGTVLAIAAATAFTATPAMAKCHHHHHHHHHVSMVKCLGVNGCRGMSSCQTANNACKGQNSCNHRGFVTLPRTKCQQVLGPNWASEKQQ